MRAILVILGYLGVIRISKLLIPFEPLSSWFESMPASHTIPAPTPFACFVDSSARRRLCPYPQHSAGSRALWGSLRLEERSCGGARSTPGLRPNPTFSLANSPVSPVDRTRLLTASSNAVPELNPPRTFSAPNRQNDFRRPSCLGNLVLLGPWRVNHVAWRGKPAPTRRRIGSEASLKQTALLARYDGIVARTPPCHPP